jgi:hypothetical protein
MNDRKCKQCGATMELMAFGLAGADWECPNGPWGTRQHETFDSFMHAMHWPVMGLLLGLGGFLLFLIIAFGEVQP